MCKFFTAILLFLCFSEVFADTFLLESVKAISYPQLQISFFPISNSGEITSPSLQGISASFDGKPLVLTSINCPEKISKQLSVAVVIDVSGSMSSGAPNIFLAKNIASKLISNINSASEVAVTTFDDNSMILHPMSENLQGVEQSLEMLKPNGGTNYETAFFNSFSGAFEILKNTKYKKVVVFITDGYGSVNENDVIAKARIENITIVCISVGMSIPKSLKTICTSTNGRWFENIKTVDQSTVSAAIAATTLSGNNACSLNANFEGNCSPTGTVIVSSKEGVQSSLKFAVPIQFRTGIEIEETHIEFSKENVSNVKSIKIINGVIPTTVTSFTSKKSSPAFSIDNSLFPLQLLPNETKEIPITYTKSDGKSYERYTISSTNCEDKTVVVSAGSGAIISSTLRVLFPNGFERFLVSSDTICRWDGIASDEKVNIDISLDNGKSWNSLAKNISGNHLQSTLSLQPSNLALLKVSLLTEASIKEDSKKRNQEYDYEYTEKEYNGIDDYLPFKNGTNFIKVTSTLGSNTNTTLKNTLSIFAIDTKTGLEKVYLELPKETTLRTVVLSPDEKKLLVSVGTSSNGSINSIFCLDVSTAKILFQNKLITYQPNLSTVYNQKKNQIFSPDGLKVIAFPWDRTQKSTVKVLNAINGTTLKDLAIEESTDNGGTFVAWHPNSEEILFGDSHLNSFSIWNSKTAKKLFTINDPIFKVKNVEYSPNGKYLICQGVDSLIKILDSKTNLVVSTIVHQHDSRGKAEGIDYEVTPDGESLLVWKVRGKSDLSVYDISTGNKAIDIGTTLEVSSLVISPNSEQVAVQYSSKSPENGVFNIITGEKEGQIGILIEPNPRGSKYSPVEKVLSKVQWADNSQLMAKVSKEWGSKTEMDRIIRFSPLPLGTSIASDVSDNVWELYALPTLSVLPASLVFDNVFVGSSKENIFTALVSTPKQGFEVDSLWIENDSENVFEIVSSTNTIQIEPEDGNMKVEIRFSPKRVGEFNAKVRYRIKGLPTIMESKLIGKSVNQDLVVTELIDFGVKHYDTTDVFVKKIYLENKSSSNIEIKNVVVFGPDTAQFKTNYNVPFVIRSNSSDSITVLFRPFIGGKTTSQIFTFHTSKGSFKNTIILAEVDTTNGKDKNMFKDPTTFRSFAIPNAVIPKSGTIVLGSYLGLGLLGGYSITDNIQVLAGGVLPLPDDWLGINGSIFGGGGIGVKIGGSITTNLSFAGGIAGGMSFVDNDISPDTTESIIKMFSPFLAVSYGNDNNRISSTIGYAFKRHTAIPPEGGLPVEFDRNAVMLTLGGDYSFANRWKITGEVISVTTSGYVPIISTIRYFGNTWAIDVGITYLGIKNTPDATALSIPFLPVLSWVLTL